MSKPSQPSFTLEKRLEIVTDLLEHTENKLLEIEGDFIGVSAHVREVKEMVHTVSTGFRGEQDLTILIIGEPGIGKETVARYIHKTILSKAALTPQAIREIPFVAINCAAYPEHLLERELFGFEKDAFEGATQRKTGLFELASGGTLFLDGLGEVDLKTQAKLLRVLQEKVVRRIGGTTDIPIQAHLIAATHRDLQILVQEGKFREDLYYRVNTLPISIAPLRSRPEDIEIHAKFFLNLLGRARGKRFNEFSPKALNALLKYRWPGNIRELRSVIERAVFLENGPTLELSHLRQEHLQATKAEVSEPSSYPAVKTGEVIGAIESKIHALPSAIAATGLENGEKGLAELRKEMDERLVKQILFQTLDREKGNVSSVARLLRVDRANLLRMLKRYSIDPALFRQTNGLKQAG